MTDKLNKTQRSANMAKIKNHNTAIELKFRKQLYKMGIRYLLKSPITGKPDLVIPAKKVAIFINGCFWHQHDKCKLAYMPKSNITFWKTKLSKNVSRDRNVKELLDKEGWKAITVWECEITKNMEEIVKQTFNTIRK